MAAAIQMPPCNCPVTNQSPKHATEPPPHRSRSARCCGAVSFAPRVPSTSHDLSPWPWWRHCHCASASHHPGATSPMELDGTPNSRPSTPVHVTTWMACTHHPTTSLAYSQHWRAIMRPTPLSTEPTLAGADPPKGAENSRRG